MFKNMPPAKVVDLEKIVKAKEIPAFIRLLAIELKQTPYIPAGAFIKNLSDYDFSVLCTLCEIAHRVTSCQEEEVDSAIHNESIMKSMKHFGVLVFLLATAEGIPEISDDNLAVFGPNLIILCFAERIMRLSPDLREAFDIETVSITDDISEINKKVSKIYEKKQDD